MWDEEGEKFSPPQHFVNLKPSVGTPPRNTGIYLGIAEHCNGSALVVQYKRIERSGGSGMVGLF
jgi:hypothetical protein